MGNRRRSRDRRDSPDHSLALVPVRRNTYAPLRFDRNREKAKQQLHSIARRIGKSQELKGITMKPVTWMGILLVIVGVLALAYGGINYTRQEKVLDIGPIHATQETHERIPLPPILGGAALVGGIALLVVGARQKS
jgi:uncharacterized membrane protein YidH (DUF202 family)